MTNAKNNTTLRTFAKGEGDAFESYVRGTRGGPREFTVDVIVGKTRTFAKATKWEFIGVGKDALDNHSVTVDVTVQNGVKHLSYQF